MWLMRQAGRYLAEYREVRAKAGSFLNLCYTPALAAEATIQPIRRFGFDAAIIFSDILVVPHALGQHLEFREGEGPHLEPIKTMADLSKLSVSRAHSTFEIVYDVDPQGHRRTREGSTPLIGFCGAHMDGRAAIWWKAAVPRLQGPQASGLSRTENLRRNSRLACGSLRHLSHRPDECRRTGGADLRQLGRRSRG